MPDKKRGQGGFTLIEVLIVISILGILVAMVVPNLAGFLGRGAGEAYAADRTTIQAAVSAYYTQQGQTYRKYPTGNGLGSDTAANNAYINFSYLVSQNLLREVPASASYWNLAGATGSYSWYVNTLGVVTSSPPYTPGVFP